MCVLQMGDSMMDDNGNGAIGGDTPQAQQQHWQITITLDAQRNVRVDGIHPDKLVMYGVMKMADEAIAGYYAELAKQAQPRIAVPGMPLPFGRRM